MYYLLLASRSACLFTRAYGEGNAVIRNIWFDRFMEPGKFEIANAISVLDNTRQELWTSFYQLHPL